MPDGARNQTARLTSAVRQKMDFDFFDIALRLGAATLAGIVIGINRDLADKPIGMRTLGLVSLGSAVVSLAAIQFQDAAATPDSLSRVVQGIIQGIMGGISFIGAGVILRDTAARRVEGLTTAATVWVTAAFGIACALAAWKLLIVATTLALILLFAIAWTEKWFGHND
ncbi:MAG: MgtC/SapB family protein [Xanthobacteraceae bacterium]